MKLFAQLITPRRLHDLSTEITESTIKPSVEKNVRAIKTSIQEGFKKTQQRYQENLQKAQMSIANAQEQPSYKVIKTELDAAIGEANALIVKLENICAEQQLAKSPLRPLIEKIKAYIQKLDVQQILQLLIHCLPILTKLCFPTSFRRQDIKDIVQAIEHLCKNDLPNTTRKFVIASSEIKKNCEQIETCNRLIKKCLAQVEQETAYGNQIINKDFQESIGTVAKLISESLACEFSGNYPAGTTLDIILAFMWSKFSTKDEFDRYIKSVVETFGKTCQEHATEEYIRSDYEKLKKETDQQRILALSFDDLVFVTLGFNFYDNALPPPIPMLNSVFYRGLEFPDCGETSLLNLITALIYENRTFNIQLLKKLGAIPALIDFFCRYQSPAAISLKEQEVHNEWAKVVSALPNVKYGKEGVCDIDAGITNMLQVINNLFPGINSFKALIDRLMSVGITVEITSTDPFEGPNAKDIENTITLSIEKRNLEPFKLEWRFKAEHFALKFPKPKAISFAELYTDAIAQRTPLLKSDIYCMAYFGMSPKQLSWQPGFTSCQAYLYLFPQYNNKQKVKVASHIAGQIANKKDLLFARHYLRAINEKISRNGAVIDKFLEAINKKNGSLEQELCRLQNDSEGCVVAIERIIENKKTELYKWACSHETLKTIVGNDAAELATTILEQPQTSDPQTEEFMQKLYASKPNLAGADQDELLDLLLALFNVPANSPPERAQFASQFFDLEFPPAVFEKISNNYALKLIIGLLRYPLSSEQENTKIVKLLLQSIPTLIKNLTNWEQVVLTLYVTESTPAELNNINHFLQPTLHEAVMSYDIFKDSIEKMGNRDYYELIKFLLEQPLSSQQEKSQFARLVISKLAYKLDEAAIITYLLKHPLEQMLGNQALIKELMRITPNFITHMNSSDTIEILKYWLQNDLQQTNWICKTMVTSFPTLIENIDLYYALKLISHLLKYPLTASQEASEVGKIIISALPKLACKVTWPSKIMFRLIKYSIPETNRIYQLFSPFFTQIINSLEEKYAKKIIMFYLEHPIPQLQKESILSKEIRENLSKIVARMDRDAALKLINKFIESPLTEEQEESLVGKILIKELLTRIDNAYDGARIIQEILTNPISIQEKEKSIFINQIMASSLQKLQDIQHPSAITSLIVNIIQHPMDRETEESNLGKNFIDTMPQLIGIVATDYMESATLITALLANPLTQAQQESNFSSMLLRTLPVLIRQLSEIPPRRNTELVIALLQRAKFPTSQDNWLDKALRPFIIQLQNTKDLDPIDLIEYMFDNPLTPEQKKSWIWQDVYPVLIETINESAPIPLIKYFLEHPMTHAQEQEEIGQAIIHLIQQNAEKAWPSIGFLLQFPMTQEQEASDFGKAIIAALPQWFGKIDSHNVQCLTQNLIHYPLNPEQEKSCFGIFIKQIFHDLIIKHEYLNAKDLLVDLLKHPLTKEQEQGWMGQAIISAIPHLIDEINKISNSYYLNIEILPLLTDIDEENTLFRQTVIMHLPKLLTQTSLYRRREIIEYLLKNPQSKLHLPEMHSFVLNNLEIDDAKDVAVHMIKNPLTPEQEQRPFAKLFMQAITPLPFRPCRSELLASIKQISQLSLTGEQSHNFWAEQILQVMPLWFQLLKDRHTVNLVEYLLEHPMPHELEHRRIGKKILHRLEEALQQLKPKNCKDLLSHLDHYPLSPEQENSRLGQFILKALPSVQEKALEAH